MNRFQIKFVHFKNVPNRAFFKNKLPIKKGVLGFAKMLLLNLFQTVNVKFFVHIGKKYNLKVCYVLKWIVY